MAQETLAEAFALRGGIMLRIALIALLVAACGGPTISGTFVLSGEVAGSGPTCSGTGGYSDIRPGLVVVVKDGAGKILGSGRLVHDPDADKEFGQCSYKFTVPVTDAGSYSVNVGSRRYRSFSRAEMEQTNWTVAFTLQGWR